MLQQQRQHWDRQNPVLMSSFEVDSVQCEHLLRGRMPVSHLTQARVSDFASCATACTLSVAYDAAAVLCRAVPCRVSCCAVWCRAVRCAAVPCRAVHATATELCRWHFQKHVGIQT